MSKIELPGEKRKGHLTLLRRARTITSREFNALTFDERLEMIRLAAGRTQYQLILEAADSAELVQALPAQDLFVLIKDLGMEDVSELIAMASAEQVTSFIDLDAWDRDRIDGKRALEWLVLAMDEGEEGLLARLRELDFPLLVLIFQKFVTVTTGPEVLLDEDARHDRDAADKIYQVRFRDSESAKLMGEILDCLNRREQGLYLQLLEAVRSGMGSLLEEEVYRERCTRLMDFGFPDPDQILDIYARIDPQSFDPTHFDRSDASSPVDGVAPGFVLTVGRARDLLAEVLDAGINPASAWDLTFLLNKAMAADRVDIGERSQVQAELDMVYGYLNLALEHLCGNDVEKAIALFERTYLLALFRLGFNLTLSLQRRARVIRESSVGPYLDGPYAALVASLSAEKPLYFAGFEESGRSTENRYFTSLEEVRRSSAGLDEIDAQCRLFEKHFDFDLPEPETFDLSGCLPADPQLVTLSDFFLTALANRLSGRPFLPIPIAGSELRLLQEKISENGRVAESLRRETLAWLAALEPGAESFGNFCFEVWDEEFCPLDPAGLDPRYVGGLLIRPG
jgi:hypothetical protein